MEEIPTGMNADTAPGHSRCVFDLTAAEFGDTEDFRRNGGNFVEQERSNRRPVGQKLLFFVA